MTKQWLIWESQDQIETQSRILLLREIERKRLGNGRSQRSPASRRNWLRHSLQRMEGYPVQQVEEGQVDT